MRRFLAALVADGLTEFWNDSADPDDIAQALGMGASGVTTNPILVTRTVLAHPERWGPLVQQLAASLPPDNLPHALTAAVVSEAADIVRPVYESSSGQRGFVCAQVNPLRYHDAAAMVDEAQAFHALRPNIAVKIPVSAAGLEAIEELASRGITTVGTTSFTMAQVVAVAEAFHRGSERYHPHQNEKPPRSFAVIMAGRLDDHLRDLAKANSLGIPEEVLTKAGLAVVKQAYQVFQECGYQSRLLIGGMRGLYHVTELAGGDMVLTVAPAMQAATLREDVAFHRSIHDPISRDTIELLWTIDDFRKAYDIDGMHPTDFATFGAFVKTQGQFIDNYRALQEFISQALTG